MQIARNQNLGEKKENKTLKKYTKKESPTPTQTPTPTPTLRFTDTPWLLRNLQLDDITDADIEYILYIELYNSFLIGQKCTVDFRN